MSLVNSDRKSRFVDSFTKPQQLYKQFYHLGGNSSQYTTDSLKGFDEEISWSY